MGAAAVAAREEVHGHFDRRGEYLYEEGHPHPGFVEVRFEVHIASSSPREQLRQFVSWAGRLPPHATLRRAVRLIGSFCVDGAHLVTAIYHPGRTEWRGDPSLRADPPAAREVLLRSTSRLTGSIACGVQFAKR